MGSLHLLLHTHWDLEPFLPEDAPVFPLSAFRFPLFPHGSWVRWTSDLGLFMSAVTLWRMNGGAGRGLGFTGP